MYGHQRHPVDPRVHPTNPPIQYDGRGVPFTPNNVPQPGQQYTDPRMMPGPVSQQHTDPRMIPGPVNQQYVDPRMIPGPANQQYVDPRMVPNVPNQQYTDPRMVPTQPARHFVDPRITQDTRGTGFGTRTPPASENNAHDTPIRSRRRRVNTANQHGKQDQYRVPERVRVEPVSTVEPEPVITTNNSSNIITEIGVLATPLKDVRGRITQYVFTGESQVKELKLTKMTTSEDAAVPPVPDNNIIGDTMYAQLTSILISSDCDLVSHATRVEYGYYKNHSSLFTRSEDGVDVYKPTLSQTVTVTEFISELKTAMADDYAMGYLVDKRLTHLVNSIMLGSVNLKIDSFAEDYLDLMGVLEQPKDALEAKLNKELLELVVSVVGKIDVSIDDADGLDIEFVSFDQQYIVLSDDVLLATDIGVSDNTKYSGRLTVESAPNLYEALSKLIVEAESLCYLLTDTNKYLLSTTASSSIITVSEV